MRYYQIIDEWGILLPHLVFFIDVLVLVLLSKFGYAKEVKKK
jgi:hypothetical protein